MGTLSRWRSPRTVLAFACVLAVFAGGGAALARTNSLKITLTPSTGKYGTIYEIAVKGYAARSGLSLALAMVTTASHACPSSYAGGFSSLSGLADSSGKPMGPRSVRKGILSRTIKAKITTSDPGTYSICAYLTRGSATKAHASAHLTITS